MGKVAESSRFWKFSSNIWNFGDAIAELIYDRLLFKFTPYYPAPWVIGSMIFDGAPLCDAETDNRLLPPYSDQMESQSVFWGCGARAAGSLAPDNAQASVFLGVRGPLTASDLNLGTDIPIGDPALFLSALYTPESSARFVGKSVCMPHFSDSRSDIELLALTGCDEVLRPLIAAHSNDDLLRIIDALASAKFVLAGAMHGAIVAAAYSVPFGYLASDEVDCPFKWADFSASVGIPCAFHQTLTEAVEHYQREIAPQIILPSMWPLLCRAPTFIRPEGLLNVLKYELSRSGGGDAAHALDPYIAVMRSSRQRTERLDKLACRIANDILPGVAAQRDAATLTSNLDEISKDNHELDNLRAALDAERHRCADLAQVVQTLTASNDAMHEELMVIEKDFVLHVTEKANEAAGARMDAQVVRIENERLSAELASAREQAAQRSAEFLEARIDARLAHAENQRLAAELEELRQQAVRQSADVTAQSAEVIEQVVRLSTLTSELNADKQALVAEVDAGRENLRKLTEELAQQRTQHDALRHELNGMREVEERLSHATAALEAELDRQNALVHDTRLNLAVAQEEVALERAAKLQAAGRLGTIVKSVQSRRVGPAVLKLRAASRHDRQVAANTDLILQFLAKFPDHQLGMSSEGREERVIAYLEGATSCVADFPLIDRNHYYARNPDVGEVGLDPFIHYLQHGQRDGRSPSPLMDYDFYVASYPEAARFEQSCLEHYLRFGVAKGYNPCEMFDTRGYLDRYPDVKAAGLNPLIHYLRHPDCQPHALFDSHFYRTSNLDVVRGGFNPLIHYLAYGREEGRPARPTPHQPQVNRQPLSGHRTEASIQGGISEAPAMPIAANANSQIVNAAAMRPLVVMIDAFCPRPDQDSGSLDQVNFVRIFRALGYDVAFAALLDFSADAAKRKPVDDAGAECITSERYVNIEEFVFLNAERISAFFLSRYNFGGSWIERARMFCPDAQVIFNTVDLHHVREERHARLTQDEKALESAAQMRTDELATVDAADVTIVVSHSEKAILEREAPGADVRVVPLIRDIPKRILPGFEARSGIAFIGGFQHAPNIDAVETFLDEVWPLLHKARPDMIFHVIGSHLPPELAERKDPNVEWVGYVPELEPHLDRVLATVAPLRFGAGAKGKVVSSLLNAVPCVASEIAFEGMGIPDGHGVIAARSPDEFASRIMALADDPELWAQTSKRGFEAVNAAYSIEKGIEIVAGILPRMEAK
ncbi:hypothetical protein NVSP9465_02253 [Novosphingobium sp. CECT 9465]|nr:hypothetical protein NVSP9465_02253 [Novosphingobium sp. CECT 9465]